jgi:hypothetical protein
LFDAIFIDLYYIHFDKRKLLVGLTTAPCMVERDPVLFYERDGLIALLCEILPPICVFVPTSSQSKRDKCSTAACIWRRLICTNRCSLGCHSGGQLAFDASLMNQKFFNLHFDHDF